MARLFLKHYTGFSRHILSEFMTEKELEDLDKKYNEAKINRLLKLAYKIDREKIVYRVDRKHRRLYYSYRKE